MQKQIEQVKRFMTTFGQTVRTTPSLVPMEEALLRVRLLKEEVQELEDAILAGDLVEIADAFIDIDYIQKGGLLVFGLADIATDLFDEVQRSNMSKLDANGNVVRREDGKILKSDLYSKPNLSYIVHNALTAQESKFDPADCALFNG